MMATSLEGADASPGQFERRPGLHDVARLAGVSHQTVSRVINDQPNVRPETRERVLEAIERVGYRRNVAARALATSRTNTVGLLMQGEPSFGPSSTMLAVTQAARESGLYVSLAVVGETSQEATAAVMDHFQEQGVEGIVVIAPESEVTDVARATATPAVPVVVVAAGEQPTSGLYVAAVDQQLGAALATRHLLELGHRDVIHVAGPLNWHDASERVLGWQQERSRWDLPPLQPVLADWTPGSGYEAGRRLLAAAASDPREMPTAIFAANDQLALGLLCAFDQAGLDVPGRVSVVGFDDVEGAGYFSPPLTTIRQPFEALGQACISLLLNPDRTGSVEGRGIAQVPPALVVRATTSAPPAGVGRPVEGIARS